MSRELDGNFISFSLAHLPHPLDYLISVEVQDLSEGLRLFVGQSLGGL